MSAVDEFREYVGVPDSHYLPVLTVIDIAGRAIAELEAENERLNGRQCETCLHWRAFIDMGLGVGDCEATKRFCITNQLHSPSGFSCSWWQLRDAGGES